MSTILAEPFLRFYWGRFNIVIIVTEEIVPNRMLPSLSSRVVGIRRYIKPI